LTKHNFDKNLLPQAPAFESVIIIYAFAKAPKQLKTNEYIGVRPEDRKLFGYKGSLENDEYCSR
jgi:DNA polymerase-3 subunit alpha/error-prone DNA polymerase